MIKIAIQSLSLSICLGLVSPAWAKISHTIHNSACPDTSQGETQKDCPWASIARTLSQLAGSEKDVSLVRNEIESGFELPRGTLGPRPRSGTFFQNVTYFVGSIAFRNDPTELAAIKPNRLEETVKIRDSRQPQAQLITAFPVEKSFVEKITNPESLGDNRPISTWYNGYVEGLTGQSPPLTGSRHLHGNR